MHVLDHADTALERWRDGVMTRPRVSFAAGAHQLCIFDQFCDPGLGAPTHTHAVEEVLDVIAGRAEVWLGEARRVVEANQSVLIPPGARHGFRNLGPGILHVRATLAAAVFEAQYDGSDETRRRWFGVSTAST